ncbi:hypothetical protein CR969_01915 [Candidatus Saccharibacteria bacterium]|nr:MAG: hypothetical protein CR969_01915 [Candidatus Saccharibacteria bacterium]
MAIANRRESIYVAQIRRCLSIKRHATSRELLIACREKYPSVSFTTIHRVVQRMIDDGELALAPMSPDGERRVDINVLPHDHFECSECGYLKDIRLPGQIYETIDNELGGCHLDGPLLIKGNCHSCLNEGGKNGCY